MLTDQLSVHFTVLSVVPSPSTGSTRRCVTGLSHFQHKRLHKNYRVHCQGYSKDSNNPLVTLEKDSIRNDHVPESSEKMDAIAYIKWLLSTMNDGRISVSPYDTAWVALIEDVNKSGSPQFPSSLDWIAQNQLLDGSWGDAMVFSPYDRLLNTLACVIALKSWNLHAVKIDKGIQFFKENMCMLESSNMEHITSGFEVIFPRLLERAEDLGIDIPYDAPFVKEIFALRDAKLKRIPNNLMHTVPTTLLFSLEGFENLEWEKLIELQMPDGSFLTSPSSTAFAFMHTGNGKCFNFLRGITKKFNGGAPTTYPVDIFARLWAVDRLQRLGISRYFAPQLNECLNYVYRFWSGNGVFSGRNSNFNDIDDTAMGFRLLRLHGYDVNPDVFMSFKNKDGFCCYPGQTMESSSPIFNLYRASQVQYPGEKILEEAKEFSYIFLQENLASDQLLDKWIISKDLASEVRYGLEVPWYANLPRVETRWYIEQYGAANDVWIAKTLYRMPEISNNVYLKLAKEDYNTCQAQHQIEWSDIQEWHLESNLQGYGISKKDLLHAYFQSAATIFEPERSEERLAWTKSLLISRAIKFYFNQVGTSLDERKMFLEQFKRHVNLSQNWYRYRSGPLILRTLFKFLHQLSMDAILKHGKCIGEQLQNAWEAWLMKTTAMIQSGEEAELLVQTINICSGYVTSDEILSHPEYKHLSSLTSKICHRLEELKNEKVSDIGNGKPNFKVKEVEPDMQEFLQLVLQSSSTCINQDIKQTFLAVAKTFYYTAYFAQETIERHISKVLFEHVV